MDKTRIAYISLHWPRTASSSIGKKIIQQTGAWRAAGFEVQFFSHMHPAEDSKPLIEGRRFIYEFGNGRASSIITEVNRSSAAAKLINDVKAFKPDLIYLRWAMYVYPIQRLFRIAPVVVEINTHDVREHRLLGRPHALYNRLTRGVMLGRAAGHVFATRELMDLPDFSRFHRSGIVVTNSIDLSATPYYQAPANKIPRLVFIGTPGMAWHGVDKLVGFASLYPDLAIDIVGLDSIDGFSSLPGNLTLHGLLEGAAYEAVLARADAAIGTLSLYIKDMEEAATLKIRDCAARGIPCVLPYLDSDFEGLPDALFLRIPNTPDNMQTHGQAVHDFVRDVAGKRVSRDMISSRIHSRFKEAKRLELNSIMENRC